MPDPADTHAQTEHDRQGERAAHPTETKPAQTLLSSGLKRRRKFSLLPARAAAKANNRGETTNRKSIAANENRLSQLNVTGSAPADREDAACSRVHMSQFV
jgi:hypothetical protein